MNKIFNFLLKLGSGYEVIEDYGLIDSADNAFGLGQYQELRFLKGRLKNGTEAFILEETTKGKFMAGLDKEYFIVSEQGMKKFQNLLNNTIFK